MNESLEICQPASEASTQTSPINLLINYITKHQLPVLEELQKEHPQLQVLVSVDVEPQRDYQAQFGDLHVVRQKNITLRKTWKHVAGFHDAIYVHIPWDTFFRLLWNRPKIVVSYELGARSLMSALYRSLFPKSRLLLCVNVSEHTEASWGRWRRLVRPWLLRRADAITYNGISCKRYLRSVGVPEEKLFHFPYAAHPATVYQGPVQRAPQHRHRLLWVGQFSERKNPILMLEQLVKWARLHPQQQVELTMVGKGPLQGAIQQLELPGNFRLNMVGVVSPEDMPAVWAEHGVMIFPTLADEWGMVVNEAMHSGLPVLGSLGAQSSLACIEDGVSGWTFPPTDASAIYHAIDRMMQCSVETLDQMGQAAREAVAFRTPTYAAAELSRAIAALHRKS